MNSKSTHKDAAWEFIKWATSKDVVLKTQQKGNPGARASVWDKPEGISGFPTDLVPIIKESSAGGVDHDRPVVVSVGEARDVVGNVVLAVMQGQDVKAAAEKANKELQAIMDKDNSTK